VGFDHHSPSRSLPPESTLGKRCPLLSSVALCVVRFWRSGFPNLATGGVSVLVAYYQLSKKGEQRGSGSGGKGGR
jgi:hypothetical protein